MKSLILILSLLKSGKILTTFGSMVLSLGAYAMAFGWKFASGFIFLLFAHEMGHYLAAKQKGLDVGAPTFIPFVGAWINLKQQPHDAEVEAYVGFAGPFLGSIATLLVYLLARRLDSSLLLAITYSGLMLNLFNLIPVSPLDGGRITAVLTPRIWLFGIPALTAWFMWKPSPMLIVIAVLAIPQFIKAFRYNEDTAGDAAYYRISGEARLTYSIYYLGLTGFLSMMAYELHTMLRLH